MDRLPQVGQLIRRYTDVCFRPIADISGNGHPAVMELEKYQAAVLATVFERADISDSVEWFQFALSGDFRGQFVAVAAKVGTAGERIVFNLPTYSTDVFVGLTDKDPKAVALILANLEDYERENGLRLRLGEAVVIPTSTEAPFAVLLLRPATLLDAAALPDAAEIAGRPTAFLLAVPLSREEYDFRAAHGHDGLLDHFEEVGKSLAF